MEMLVYSEENRSVVIPWILDPEHDGLDLEVDGCGCGCGDGGCGSCGCSCTCSCSCSCSCDSTGANGDDDYSGSTDDDGGGTASGPSLADAVNCFIDSTINVTKEAVTEVIAAFSGKGVSVATVAAGTAASSSMINAALQTSQESPACQQVDEDSAQFAAERLAELEGSDSLQKATETLRLVH